MSRMLKALQRIEDTGKPAAASENAGDDSSPEIASPETASPDASQSPRGAEEQPHAAAELPGPAPVTATVTQNRQMQQPAPGDFVQAPPAAVTQPLGHPPAGSGQSYQPPSSAAWPGAGVGTGAGVAPGAGAASPVASRDVASTQPFADIQGFNPYAQPETPAAAPEESFGNTLLRSIQEEEAQAAAAKPPATSAQSLEARLERLRESTEQLYAESAESNVTVPGIRPAAHSHDVITGAPSVVTSPAGGAAVEDEASHQLASESLASESLASESLASESLASESLASENLASENLASDAAPPDDSDDFIDLAADDTPAEDTPAEYLPQQLEAAAEDRGSTVVFNTAPSEPVEQSPLEPARTISSYISEFPTGNSGPKEAGVESTPAADPDLAVEQSAAAGLPQPAVMVKPHDVLSHIRANAAGGASGYDAADSYISVDSDGAAVDSPLHRLTTAPAGEGEAVMLQRLQDATIKAQFTEIVANLESSFPGGTSATVLLLSQHDQSETSYVASAAALTAARQMDELVLLVDGNPGWAKVSTWFETAQKSGFVETLNGKDWRNFVEPSSVEGLHVLSAGQGMITALEQAPEQFCRAMSEIQAAYRFVIIDGGSLQEPLAQIMARHCDTTLLVVELGRSQADNTVAAIDHLRNAGARVAGAVATNAPPY